MRRYLGLVMAAVLWPSPVLALRYHGRSTRRPTVVLRASTKIAMQGYGAQGGFQDGHSQQGGYPQQGGYSQQGYDDGYQPLQSGYQDGYQQEGGYGYQPQGGYQDEYNNQYPPHSNPDQEVVMYISQRLQEPQVRIVRAVVDYLGATVAYDLLDTTEQIQARGGMIVPETGRPRTSGGVYLRLLKEATHLPRDAQNAALHRIKAEGKGVKSWEKGVA
jgi:hypothetical protein